MSEFTFKLPDLGEGTVESEIGEWFIKVGDKITEADLVGTMMTDKAAVELSSPVSGTVVSLAGEPGDIVNVGAALVVIETDASSAAAAPVAAEKPAPAAAPPTETKTPASRNKIATSPAIRRRAKDAGVDLEKVSGSGSGGRILRKDLDAYLQQTSADTAQARPAALTAAPAKTALADTETKVIGIRRVIAERMSTAKREIPHFSYVEEMDVTELEALRQHLNKKSANSGERLSLLPFIALALIRALQEFPQCNTTYDKDRNILIGHGSVHMGIATQTPDGLKVPVVRNCEQRSVTELSAEIRRVSEAARDNSIKRDELSGSTITLTSLGKLGGIASTPVINMPEVSIIGVNRAVERPVVFNGQVAVRLMMNLSSSFDHRFVDGYDAAAMIQRIKEMLEHPATIFLAD
jgi:2-oxoisovalerate dehydrogenase E2 component (dihydrolipoyl transacylase)